MSYLLLGISAILVNNIILTNFLGICPLLGVSKTKNSAVGMGLAVIFVVFMSSLLSHLIYAYVLVPLSLEFLKLVSFILIIAAFVQFIEMFMKRFIPALYKSLGIYLPLITTNCVVLAVALNSATNFGTMGWASLLNVVVYSLGAGAGYAMILIIFSFIQERLIANKNVPQAFKGTAVALVTIGLLVMAFTGFQGLI